MNETEVTPPHEEIEDVLLRLLKQRIGDRLDFLTTRKNTIRAKARPSMFSEGQLDGYVQEAMFLEDLLKEVNDKRSAREARRTLRRSSEIHEKRG
jgi:hypothetical protein